MIFIVLACSSLILYSVPSIFLSSQSYQDGHPPGWSAWPARCHLSGHNLEPLEIDLYNQNRPQELGSTVRCQEGRTGRQPSSLAAAVWSDHLHHQNQVHIQTELDKFKLGEGSGGPFWVWPWLTMVAVAFHTDLRHAQEPPSPSPPLHLGHFPKCVQVTPPSIARCC